MKTKKIHIHREFLSKNEIILHISKNIYSIDSIFNTAYKFLDACSLFVDEIDDTQIQIYFKFPNNQLQEIQLTIIDSFYNELIEQEIKFKLENKFGTIRDKIIEVTFPKRDK